MKRRITSEIRATMPSRGQGKLNRTVKETVLAVFNQMQENPKTSLKTWGEKEPTEFYRIASKLIPTELAGNLTSKIQVTIVRGKPTS